MRASASTTAAQPASPAPGLNGARAFALVVVAVGTVIIVNSLLALRTTPWPFEWMIFAALAVVSGSFSLKIATVSASLTVSDTFFMTAAMLFGPAAATLTVAVDTLIVSLRRRHNPWRIAFNTTAPALSVWAGSHVFFRLAGVAPIAGSHAPIATLILPLLGLTVVYFLLNSGLTAVAIGLEKLQSPLGVWRKHFLWLSFNYLASGSVSLCLILLIYQVSLGAVIVVLPLLAVFHLTLRSSFGRLEDAQRHLGALDHLYLSTVETLAMAIDAKDDVTHNHVRRVQAYAMGLARELGVVDELALKAIEAAALLHDTGKLAVPEHILNKPGKLSEAEFEQMKLHVDVGADILSLVEFPYPVVPIVRCHHESWDGSGYPRGVRGEDIPIGARILSVVDCFDALTSDRPYRAAMTSEQAFDILRERSGKMYDPHVVETFIAVQPRIAPDDEDAQARQHTIQQIVRAAKTPPAAADAQAAPATSAIPDDVLAFVSLSRLASGDHTVADVLALASTLLRDSAAQSTLAWYVLDSATNMLTVAHANGPASDVLRGLSIPLASKLSGWVAANRQPIVNSDPALDLGAQAAGAASLQSSLSVPLVSGDALVGVLTLYASRPRAFSDDQGRLIQMIAPHVASAISRARRHETAAADTHVPVAEKRAVTGTLRLVAASR